MAAGTSLGAWGALLKCSGFPLSRLSVNRADTGPGDLCLRCFEVWIGAGAPCVLPASARTCLLAE